jgi:hypothetical protein
MRILSKIALVAMMFATAFAVQAGPVRGYFRSNGTYVAPHYRSDARSLGGGMSSSYTYRNPYAAVPSVRVGGYFRSTGSYVAPHVRTAPNWTPTDNLNYRGFGTIRVPKY